MVQRRARYIDGCTPRVYGYSPGAAVSAAGGTSVVRYTGFTGAPDEVANSAFRSSLAIPSERDVAMFPGRVRVPLRPQQLEDRDEPRPRVARLDHFVDVATLRRHVRIGELLPVLARPDLLQRRPVGGRLDV